MSDTLASLEPLEGEWVHLDPSRHGLEQVAGWLHGQTNVKSVHVLAHGAAGQLTLGASVLDAQSLSNQHADALAVIASALAPQAVLSLHGADLNADAAGAAFIFALASITGAHVVASDPARAAAVDLPSRDVVVSTAESAPVHGVVDASWAGQTQLTFCIGSMPINGTLLVQADGAWSYTPDDEFHGQDAFSIVVLQGRRIKDTVNVQVAVLREARKPVATGASAPSGETSVCIDIDAGALGEPGQTRLVTAIDGLAVLPDEVVAVNRGQVVAGLDGSLAFLPAPDFMGATTFACTVTDSLGGTAEVQVQVETLDGLVVPPVSVRGAVFPDAGEGARLRAALLSAFEGANPGQPACFLAPMTAAEGLRLAQPGDTLSPAWPPGAADAAF